ncbi:hypothetical protein C8F04DRAFT_1187125 [Mycena alexandri]|uniref:Uncharacterized protein n=1 Tax=Mycena alexandri TaxID=1745969 RepID=A0AAD6SPA1_9AGAR|nr:hypothetical protein C8F04DRAFT_1187125 [Mycena alexandri]
MWSISRHFTKGQHYEVARYPPQVELTLAFAAESNFDILLIKLLDLNRRNVGHAQDLPHHALNSLRQASSKFTADARAPGLESAQRGARIRPPPPRPQQFAPGERETHCRCSGHRRGYGGSLQMDEANSVFSPTGRVPSPRALAHSLGPLTSNYHGVFPNWATTPTAQKGNSPFGPLPPTA